MRLSFGPSGALVGLTVGGTFIAAGAAMLVCAVAAALDEGSVAAFTLPGAATLAAGILLLRASVAAKHRGLSPRPVTGLLAVTLAWFGSAVVGSIPLLAAGVFSSPVDAFFEATSGFTTSGATLIGTLELEPDSVLLWRSLMQWLGGIGIVVLVVAIAPVSGPGVQRAFYAETSGITAERLTPRIIDTAKIIAAIYLSLSAAVAVAYAVAGMGAFDAVNHAMTTIATAGFSTRTASIGAFDSVPIELVAMAGMILGGINFAFYWRAIRGRPVMPQGAEVAAFLAILIAAIAVVTVSVELASEATLREAAFSVTSVITTTGYTTADFDSWNSFARIGFLVMMFVGACAGSTAGGMKVIRMVLLGKAARQEIDRQLQPRRVSVLRLGGHTYSEDVRRAVLGYFLVYVVVYVTGALALAATGVDPVTAISGASSAVNLIGPALGDIGATQTWEAMPGFGRAVAAAMMIIGRLEVFTVVALLVALIGSRRGR